MAARGSFSSVLEDWNKCVPFLIKLRSYVGERLPTPDQFLDGVAGPVAGTMPPGWVHRQLSSGWALLLIDGVDEIPADARRAVRDWVRGLLKGASF